MAKRGVRTRKILFLVPYPLNQSPSQRFRFEQYFSILEKEGFGIVCQSFLPRRMGSVLYESGKPVSKAAALFLGALRRIAILILVPQVSYVFIHREAAPLGPPFLEWIIARFFKKKIVYDFDDAIWMTDRTNEPVLLHLLKARSKVAKICQYSYKISCGNQYLCNYAMKFNSQVVLNPTTIDIRYHRLPAHGQEMPKDHFVIGWTGSHSTIKYLESIHRILAMLCGKYPHVNLMVIADQPPNLPDCRVDYRKWTAKSEIDDLAQFDVGIMPLPDDEWSKGKCGFKILQYMALGIPAVASAVGVNATIIENGVNGLLATSDEEWIENLEALIKDRSLRLELGAKGRQTVREGYSVDSNAGNFLALFT